MVDLTPEQEQFCEDVIQAVEIWHDTMSKKIAKRLGKQVSELEEHELEYFGDELEADQDRIERQWTESEQTPQDKFRYLRSLNTILMKCSGAGVPELIGTGNPADDYERSFKILD